MKSKSYFVLIMLLFIIIFAGCQKVSIPVEQKQNPSSPVAPRFNQSQNVQVPNPASKFCIDNGGDLLIQNEPAGQKGICTLKDGTVCEEWAYFRGECGPKTNTNSNVNSNATLCTNDQRNADVCITLYDPVCGWFNQNIVCIAFPCAQTYSNSCNACKDEKVESWTKGECPKTGNIQ